MEGYRRRSWQTKDATGPPAGRQASESRGNFLHRRKNRMFENMNGGVASLVGPVSGTFRPKYREKFVFQPEKPDDTLEKPIFDGLFSLFGAQN
jgi:hypothetical protein